MKKIVKIIMVVMVLGVYLKGSGGVLLGEEVEEAGAAHQAEDVDVRTGLHGKFYKNQDFSNVILVGQTDKGLLGIDMTEFSIIDPNEKIAAAVWSGYIQTKETLKGRLEFKNLANATVELGDKQISQGEEVELKKGETVSVKITCVMDKGATFDELAKVELRVKSDQNNYAIARDEFYLPEYEKSEWIEDFKEEKHSMSRKDDPDEDIDTDGDSIPDVWEINGYTIQAKKAVKWDDSFAAKGYTKFVSNPYEARTVGDPYTDFQKAANDIPASNDRSTRNPLVAAYPIVSASLEKLILSPNEDLSHSVGSSSHSDFTESNTIGTSAGGGANAEGPKFDISVNYSHSWSTTTGWSNSTDDTTHLNTAEAAYLNANVRYINTGTGAIYDVKPTTSFVLGEDTIGTITAKENTTALSIEAGGVYPKRNQNGIAINTMDDFDSRPIPLNKDQKDSFMEQKASMVLETDQVDGEYAIKDIGGKVVRGGSWSTVTPEIEKRTASIIFDISRHEENKLSEYRVAGKDYSDPEDMTPEVTLGESLRLAYPTEVSVDKGGNYYYKNTLISEGAINFYMDEATSDMVKKQLDDTAGIFKDVKYMYQVKLEQEMNFTLIVSDFYENFEGDLQDSLFKGVIRNQPDFNIIGPSQQSMSGSYSAIVSGREPLTFKQNGTNQSVTKYGQKLYFSDDLVNKLDSEDYYRISFYRKGSPIIKREDNFLVPIYLIKSHGNPILIDCSPENKISFDSPLNPNNSFTKQFMTQQITHHINTPTSRTTSTLIGFWIESGTSIDDVSFMKVPKSE